MHSRYAAPAAAIALVALLAASPAYAYTSPVVGGTNVLTVLGLPALRPIGQLAIATNYWNNALTNVTAIVVLTVHNSSGQTVYYTASTITVPFNGNSTAYDVIFGLPNLSYNATVFAILPSGSPISNTTTIGISL